MSANFEYYKIFYYVARYGNFTQAANALLSSQPAITRAMQNLENELGCRLFIRSRHGVTLTAEGELLYSHVQPACEHLLKGEEDLDTTLNLRKGIIYIGTTETALHCYLLEKLSIFHKLYPGVRMKLINNSTPSALQDIKSGIVDLALVTTPFDCASPLKWISLKSCQDILVGGLEFEHLAQGVHHLADLSQYPLVSLSPNTMTHQFYHQFYNAHHQILRPDIELAAANLILPVIERGLGIGYIPEEMVADKLKKHQLVQIQLYEKIPQREICMVWDSKRPLSTAMRQVIKLFKDDLASSHFPQHS